MLNNASQAGKIKKGSVKFQNLHQRFVKLNINTRSIITKNQFII